MTYQNNKNYSVLIIDNNPTIENNLKFFLLRDDNYSTKTLEKFDNENYNLIINNGSKKIDESKYQNIIDLSDLKPFRLNFLLNKIDDILKKENNIIRFNNFSITNNIFQFKDKNVDFGHKEMELIRYLYSNPNSDKNEILENIWRFSADMDTKVLENTIAKIKQKTKEIGVENFILNNNGKYSLCQ